MMYLKIWQLATELCLHVALIAQEICLFKERVGSDNMQKIFLFSFRFISLEKKKMHKKQTSHVSLQSVVSVAAPLKNTAVATEVQKRTKTKTGKNIY